MSTPGVKSGAKVAARKVRIMARLGMEDAGGQLLRCATIARNSRPVQSLYDPGFRRIGTASAKP